MSIVSEARPRLSTERLVLRSPEARDASRIVALAGDPGVARMTTSIPNPLTLDQAEAFLARMETRDDRIEALFTAETEADGPIGLIGLHPYRDRTPELGYWFGRPFWGRGYATEAVLAILAWVGEGWGKRWLVAGHFDDNPASARVLDKAGFLYTGRIEHRFSLARDEEARTRMMVWVA